jgi:hypothetical protein
MSHNGRRLFVVGIDPVRFFKNAVRAEILLTVFVLLFCGSAARAEDPAILHIRQEYQSIRNAMPTMQSEPSELSGYSTEGGEAQAFRDSTGDIRLIKVELYFESGKVFEEFYYENGKLIFAFYQSHRYNVPFNVTPEMAQEIGGEAFDPEKTVITEDRYYFDNGSMIRWLDANKREVTPDSTEFKKSEKEIMDMSHKMLSTFTQES